MLAEPNDARQHAPEGEDGGHEENVISELAAFDAGGQERLDLSVDLLADSIGLDVFRRAVRLVEVDVDGVQHDVEVEREFLLVVHQPLAQAAVTRLGGALPTQGLGQAVIQQLHAFQHEDAHNIFFALEIDVKGGFAIAGGFRDVVHRGGRDPPLREKPLRRRSYALPMRAPWLFLPSPHWHPFIAN